MSAPLTHDRLHSAENAAQALDRAAANVLLAFHDFPQYVGGVEERCDSLDALADALSYLRAAHPVAPTPAPPREAIPADLSEKIDAVVSKAEGLGMTKSSRPNSRALITSADRLADARAALDSALAELVREAHAGCFCLHCNPPLPGEHAAAPPGAPSARETETPLPDGLIAGDDWDGSTPLVNAPGMIAEIRRLQRENAALRASSASSQRVEEAAREVTTRD